MDSVGLTGKYWIVTNDDVVDCSTDEHARIARAHMLDIFPEDIGTEIPLNTIFDPLTVEEEAWHRSRTFSRIDPNAIDFLAKRSGVVDPRVYVIRELGWIRTRENAFYAWEWDAVTCSRLLNNDKFWEKHRAVNEFTWIDLRAVKTGNVSGGAYGSLSKKYKKEYAPCH